MTVEMRRARSLIGGLVTAHAPFRQSGRSHSLVWFVLLVVCAQAITYFVVGALAFATLTHGLYEGPDPLFGSYLRTPSETELWRQVTLWFLPAQLFRGILMGLALRPFVPLLRRWSVWRRTVAITGLYVTMGFWAAAVAAPGNIEGLVYLRPEFSLDVALLVQPEIVVQGAAMALLVALGLGRRSPAGPAGGKLSWPRSSSSAEGKAARSAADHPPVDTAPVDVSATGKWSTATVHAAGVASRGQPPPATRDRACRSRAWRPGH